MATTTGQMTWQAFEQLPDGDGFHREVAEGELVVLPPAKSRHALITNAVARRLGLWRAAEPGRFLAKPGTGFPPTWIQPDVSVQSSERAQATSGDDYFVRPPELAVEVVSPSETARDLNRKVGLLLAGGSLVVWVIYPESREVRVFSSDGTSCTRRGDELLSLPEMVPGWELAVANLLAD